MGTQEDIIAFSQSEKLKAGVIWIQQIANSYIYSSEEKKAGLRTAVEQMLALLEQELFLAKRVASGQEWLEVERSFDKAATMLSSDPHELGVQECVYHLTLALSHITNIGQRTMGRLFNKD